MLLRSRGYEDTIPDIIRCCWEWIVWLLTAVELPIPPPPGEDDCIDDEEVEEDPDDRDDPFDTDETSEDDDDDLMPERLIEQP